MGACCDLRYPSRRQPCGNSERAALGQKNVLQDESEAIFTIPEVETSTMTDLASATRGQFEIKRDGETAFLAYEIDGEGWISLLHTQVPEPIRGRGVANELAKKALDYAKEHQLKVDVVCPVVFHYVTRHPEYKPLLGIRGYR